MSEQLKSAIGDRIAASEHHLIKKPEQKTSPLNPLAYDTTFADDGKLSITPSGRHIHWVSSIVRLRGTSNQYLASFYEAISVGNPDTYTNFAGLVRFDSDGAIDTSFGDRGDGFVEVRFSDINYSMPTELIELNSGALLIAGMQISTVNSTFRQTWMLAKHKPDGHLDIGFANNGVFNLSEATGRPLRTEGVVELPDGKILVAATATEGPVAMSCLIRLHVNGQIDSSFGERGIKEIKISTGNATSLAGLKSDADGKRLLAYGYYQGLSFQTGFIARLDIDGEVDPDFGVRGFVDIAPDQPTDVRGVFISAQDNHILVAGSLANASSRKYEGLLMRYLQDGSADMAFNDGKPVHLSFHESSVDDYWNDARTLPGEECKILVLGTGSIGPQDSWSAAGKFDSQGKLDNSFAGGTGIGSPLNASFFSGGAHIDERERLLCAGVFNGTAAVFAVKV